MKFGFGSRAGFPQKPAGSPAPPAFTLVVQRDTTSVGSSSTAGNQDATGATYWTAMRALADNLNSKVHNQLGAGGATDVAVSAQVSNATTAQKAADFILQYGGNSFNNSGDAERHYTAWQSSLSAIGHERHLSWVSHNASTEVFGSATWARARKLIRAQHNHRPGQAVDMSYIYRYWPASLAQDLTDQSNDIFPTSLRNDPSHLNAAGYTYGSQQVFQAWFEAMNGGIPFIAPYMKLLATAATAQTNGGFVLDVPFVGGALNGSQSLTGVTAQTVGDSDFACSVTGGAVRITRSSSTLISEARRLLKLRLTKGGRSRDYTIQLSLSALNSTPVPVAFGGSHWFINDINLSGLTNTSRQLTIVFDWEALGGDGAAQKLLFTCNGTGISIERLSTHTVRIFARDANSTATSIVSLTSTQQLAVANGRRWVFFELDTTEGATSAKLIVDDSTPVTATPANPSGTTGGAFINFAGATTSFATLVGSSTANGSSLINAKVALLWVGAGILSGGGIGSQANRDLFRNATTKVALDIGASGVVGGVTPFLYMRGSAGDRFHGRNHGTGGDLIYVDKGLPS